MSEQSKISKRKQSIIAGGLISSAGIFVAKFIGLFYAVPFNNILETPANLAYYAVAFSIYSYVLNICIAGFPFAIATLIAKYVSRGDYQTSLLIKTMATKIMMGLGFIAMLFVIVFSTPLASALLPTDANNPDVMRNVLIMISLALFFVPVLSASRGFYQGLKHMEVYALSQVLEQIVRVVFLLAASALAVYAFNQDRVWAVYFGVLSASVSAILAIIHIKLYDRKRMPEFKRLAKEQSVVPNTDKQVIFKELILMSFPYLLVAILGYSDTIINTFFVNNGLQAHGETPAQIELIVGSINYGVLKLMSIPMILAPGFTAAIIPHITTALTKLDYKLVRRNIRECVDIVLYIGLPLCFCLFVFAKPVYGVLFPPADPNNLDLLSQILSWFSIEAFLSTIAPIFTALLMAVGLRRLNIRNLAIMVAIKFAITYPLIAWLGYPGTVISSMIAMGLFITMDAHALATRYHVKWKYTFFKLLFICFGLVGIFAVQWVCDYVGLKGYGSGRMLSLLQLAISGTLSICAYIAITAFFQVPQMIFHIDIATIKRRFKRG